MQLKVRYFVDGLFKIEIYFKSGWELGFPRVIFGSHDGHLFAWKLNNIRDIRLPLNRKAENSRRGGDTSLNDSLWFGLNQHRLKGFITKLPCSLRFKQNFRKTALSKILEFFDILYFCVIYFISIVLHQQLPIKHDTFKLRSKIKTDFIFMQPCIIENEIITRWIYLSGIVIRLFWENTRDNSLLSFIFKTWHSRIILLIE